jgi:hypothetical protein
MDSEWKELAVRKIEEKKGRWRGLCKVIYPLGRRSM